jgi:hypothetical protein
MIGRRMLTIHVMMEMMDFLSPLFFFLFLILNYIKKIGLGLGVMVFKHHFQQYFSYIVAVIDKLNHSTPHD